MKFINSFRIEYSFFFCLREKFLFLRIIFQGKRSTRHLLQRQTEVVFRR